MGFQYPHYDAEFLVGVVVVTLVAMVVFPIARWLPSWAGTPLAFLPLALLLAWSAWMWYRVRRG
jgi:hypothetical protein